MLRNIILLALLIFVTVFLIKEGGGGSGDHGAHEPGAKKGGGH